MSIVVSVHTHQPLDPLMDHLLGLEQISSPLDFLDVSVQFKTKKDTSVHVDIFAPSINDLEETDFEKIISWLTEL